MADHPPSPHVLWRATSPWAGGLPTGRIGRSDGPAGLTVTGLSGDLATIVAGPGLSGQISTRLATAFGAVPPATPRIVTSPSLDLIWSGLDQWLARAAMPGLAGRLVAQLGESAAVTDQSASRAVLRLTGPRVREVLAKGCMIDLHPGIFKSGHAALTAIAHIGVQIWRPEDADADPNADDVFEIAASRSYAGSLWSWLAAASAEFGCEVPASGGPADGAFSAG